MSLATSPLEQIACCVEGALKQKGVDSPDHPAVLVGKAACKYSDVDEILVKVTDGPHCFTLEFDTSDPDNFNLASIDRLDGTIKTIYVTNQDRITAFADYLLSLMYDD